MLAGTTYCYLHIDSLLEGTTISFDSQNPTESAKKLFFLVSQYNTLTRNYRNRFKKRLSHLLSEYSSIFFVWSWKYNDVVCHERYRIFYYDTKRQQVHFEKLLKKKFMWNCSTPAVFLWYGLNYLPVWSTIVKRRFIS